MSPTTVQPPDPSSVTPTLDISVASREQLKELLPYQLGRYRLMELIGEGGMARVFRAVLQGPAGFQKMVAVKLLKASIQYEGAGAEFMQEAVYAGRLDSVKGLLLCLGRNPKLERIFGLTLTFF